jgi:lambda family phage portal protein
LGYFSNLAQAFLGRPAAWTTSGYNAATSGRRMISAGSSTRGISSLALADGPMLTARARKACMDNPRASSGVAGFVSEVIGEGIRPHSKHSDPDTRRKIEKEFALWVPQASAARRIGPGGKPDSLQDFFTQQQLVCRNVQEAGEAIARLRYRTAADLSPSGLRVPLQIDLIEPEQLAFWRTTGDMAQPTNLIRAGIEFNLIHERVAYHLYREHPGDSSIWPNSFEVVRIPAADILHIMEYIRGNQIRGITGLAPILTALIDVDDFSDATRLAQKLGAFLFAWKKTLAPDDSGFASSATAGITDTAPAGAAYVESQPGTVTMLDANLNEEFDFYAHPGVANTYEVFMRGELQTIATAMRVTYDMLTGDMNQVNYSSARVRLIAIRRQWKQFQKSVIVHQFCRPIWRAWLDAAALVGVIDAKDYLSNPEEYLNVEWLPEPWDWVDPVKDATSTRMKIESALTSREAVVAGLGHDVEDVDAAIARDHARERELGIVPVYGTSKVTETAPPDGDAEDEPKPAVPPAPAPAAPRRTGKPKRKK